MRYFSVIALCLSAYIMLNPQDASATCTGGGCYCSVSASAVNFGVYDTISKAAVDSTGNVAVSCGSDQIGDVISYQIDLSGAGNGSKQRQLVSARSTLSYNLYTHANLTTIWGDGKGSTLPVLDGYALPVLCCVTRNYTAYGRIDSEQNVSPGIYADTIIITVLW